MIRFLLNEKLVEVEDIAPDMTVLDYLRTNEVQRGSKEGCASGDCGACTVVVASPSQQEGKLSYRSINSCITFVGSLHGKQLITVEALQDKGRLHIVQQAMVEHHGSQCGFCTPGFVMSLFALSKNKPEIYDPAEAKENRHNIDLALGGNLCRCTGYRPIIDAANQVLADKLDDQFVKKEAQVYQQLKVIQSESTGMLKLDDSYLFVPQDLNSLVKLLADYPQARLLGGGTDLALEVTQQLQSLPVIIYTGDVAELQSFSKTDSAIKIGGAVTYSQSMAMIGDVFPEFAEMLTRLGAQQVRNQGTLAGNIANASPIGDTPPVLMALDALVHVDSIEGHQIIPINEFFTGYRQTRLPVGAVISEIEIPLDKAEHRLTETAQWYRQVYKISKRFEDDISAVLAVIFFQIEEGIITDARIAFGGMAATPIRVQAAEQALTGQPATLEGIKAAQQVLRNALSPLTDVRATANYRIQIAENMLARAILAYQQPQQQLEVMAHA